MPEFTLTQWVWMTTVIFGAGIVRGATGFGFSLIAIVLLTWIFPPALAASLILVWEILASLVHLPFVWRQVDWKALRWLMVGVALGTPLGVWTLVVMPPAIMVGIINAVVVVLALAMLRGARPSTTPNAWQTTGVGVVSGIINGASANGGPPVILLFLSSPAGAAVGRASLIAFFLFTDVWASLFYWREGLMTLNTLRDAVIFLPVLALGLWVGSRCFARIDEARFKKLVLMLLLVVSLTALVRSVV